MNCTEDLWLGAGLDDAIHPVLSKESVDAQVDALLEQLPEVFVVAGISLGAIVGMALALSAPQRIAGICLVSTNANAPTPMQYDGWNDWIRRLDAGEDAGELQQSILSGLLSPRSISDRPDLVERALRMGRETGAARLRAQLRMQGSRVDLLGRLSSLRAPALVVSGRDDEICRPGFHTEIASAIPRARLVSYDAGHLLPMERPHEFGHLLKSWQAQQRA